MGQELSKALIQPVADCMTKLFSGDSECDCGFCKCHCRNAESDDEGAT